MIYDSQHKRSPKIHLGETRLIFQQSPEAPQESDHPFSDWESDIKPFFTEQQRVDLRDELSHSRFSSQVTTIVKELIELATSKQEADLVNNLLYKSMSSQEFLEKYEKMITFNPIEAISHGTKKFANPDIEPSTISDKRIKEQYKKNGLELASLSAEVLKAENAVRELLETSVEPFRQVDEDEAKKDPEARNKDEVQQVLLLNPKAEDYKEKLRSILDGKNNDDNYLTQLISLKEDLDAKQEAAEQKSNQLREIVTILEGAVDFERQKEARIQNLSQNLGLNMRTGSKFKVIDYNTRAQHGEKFKSISHAEIKDMRYVKADPDLDREEASYSKEEDEYVLKIALETTREDGTVEKITLSDREFRSMMQGRRITENIRRKSELDSRLKLLKSKGLELGQEFEYPVGGGKYKTAKVKDIRQRTQDGEWEIAFDKELLVHPQFKMHRLMSGFTDNDLAPSKSVLTFDEFLKWQTRTNALEKINLDELKEHLKVLPKQNISKLRNADVDSEHKKVFRDLAKSIDETDYIQLEEGEIIQLPLEGISTEIQSITPDEIKLRFSNRSQSFSPSALQNFLDDHYAIRHPEQPKNLPSDQEQNNGSTQGDPKDSSTPHDPNNSNIREQGLPGNNSRIARGIGNSPNGSNLRGLPINQGRNAPKLTKLDGSFPNPGSIFNGFNIHFLSIRDIIKMGTTIYEEVKENLEQSATMRVGQAGQKLGIATSKFKSMEDKVTQERVKKYEEEMEEFTIPDIKKRLYATKTNKDMFKACMNMLTNKGAMNFEDTDFRKSLNSVARAFGLKDQVKENDKEDGPPAVHTMKAIFDEIWGDGTYSELTRKNSSTLNSEADGFTPESENYNSDLYQMGGLGAELHNMLVEFKENGTEPEVGKYMSFVRRIIEQGYLSLEERIYYLMAGISVKGPNGKTILSRESFNDIVGKYFAVVLPILYWFNAFKPEGGNLTTEYLQDIFNGFGFSPLKDEKASTNRFEKEKVTTFLRERMLPYKKYYKRASKSLQNLAKQDADDAALLIPYITVEQARSSVLTNRGAGSEPLVQEVGLRTTFAGFTEAFKELQRQTKNPADVEANQLKATNEALLQMVETFHLYGATLLDRAMHNTDSRRINPNDDSEGHSIITRSRGLFSLIQKIVRAYGNLGYNDHELALLFDLNTKATTAEFKREQDELVKGFPNRLREAYNSSAEKPEDKGREMLAVLQSHNDWII